MAKRGAAMRKLNAVLGLLMSDTPLPARNRPHMLSGEWRGGRPIAEFIHIFALDTYIPTMPLCSCFVLYTG
jgi:mRNA-degrading endonuclease YafQ of YafQ-DinJ toxin-antitoxin module